MHGLKFCYEMNWQTFLQNLIFQCRPLKKRCTKGSVLHFKVRQQLTEETIKIQSISLEDTEQTDCRMDRAVEQSVLLALSKVLTKIVFSNVCLLP